jgi:O-antigen/teichoic acid export membrane protein
MLQVVFPILSAYYEHSAGRLAQAYQSFFKALALLGLPVSLGTLILTPGLVQLLHLYPQSEPALRILAVGIVFLFVNNAFIAALNAAEGQSMLAWAMLSTLAVNLALNFALIPGLGYVGASWATVLTEAWLGIAGWYLVRRNGLRLDWWRSTWRIGLAGAAMAALIFPFHSATGIGLIFVILLGAAVYAAGVWFFRALSPAELDLSLRALRLRR